MNTLHKSLRFKEQGVITMCNGELHMVFTNWPKSRFSAAKKAGLCQTNLLINSKSMIFSIITEIWTKMWKRTLYLRRKHIQFNMYEMVYQPKLNGKSFQITFDIPRQQVHALLCLIISIKDFQAIYVKLYTLILNTFAMPHFVECAWGGDIHCSNVKIPITKLKSYIFTLKSQETKEL